MFDGKIARTKKRETEDESFGILLILCDVVCFWYISYYDLLQFRHAEGAGKHSRIDFYDLVPLSGLDILM